MQKIKMLITKKKESRLAAIVTSAKALEHYFNCEAKKCTKLAALKMERVHKHSCTCQKTNCVVCKQFLALTNFHYKICQTKGCRVPRCSAYKILRTNQRFAFDCLPFYVNINELFHISEWTSSISSLNISFKLCQQ